MEVNWYLVERGKCSKTILCHIESNISSHQSLNTSKPNIHTRIPLVTPLEGSNWVPFSHGNKQRFPSLWKINFCWKILLFWRCQFRRIKCFPAAFKIALILQHFRRIGSLRKVSHFITFAFVSLSGKFLINSMFIFWNARHIYFL